MLVFFLYAAIKTRSSFQWYNYLINGIITIVMVPYVVWYYVVAQPLPFFDSVNWMVLHTHLSHEIFLALYFGWITTLCTAIVACIFVIDWLYDAVSIECRVRSLDVRTRKALRAWAQSLSPTQRDLKLQAKASCTESALGTRAIAGVSTNAYQPLQKRAPTRDALRPITDHFESYLARPGVRLRPRTWAPRCFTLFSAPIQVRNTNTKP